VFAESLHVVRMVLYLDCANGRNHHGIEGAQASASGHGPDVWPRQVSVAFVMAKSVAFHIHESRLNGSRYQNMLCAIR